MEPNITIKNQEKSFRAGIVHFILSHSYVIFFLAVIFGIIFDLLIPVSFFEGYIYQYVGFVMIMAGSALVYWAQSTSSSKKDEVVKQMTEYDFERGPYKHLRNPTHIGLILMTFGLGVTLSSPFSILFTVIAYFITRFVFIKKQEDLLEKDYGQVYRDYKKKVKNWL